MRCGAAVLVFAIGLLRRPLPPVEMSNGMMDKRLPSVFIIGSSATLLFGPHLKQMLSGFYEYSRKGDEPGETKKALENLEVPQGASAGDSSMVLDYLKVIDQAESFRPDIVLLHVGTHDIKRDVKTNKNQVSLEEFRKNVKAIVDWFKRKGIKLIWLSNGPIDETIHNNARAGVFHRFEADLDAYNEAIETIVGRNGGLVMDVAGFVKNLGPTEQLLTDHIHFKDEIVKLQAAFIAGYLMNLRQH